MKKTKLKFLLLFAVLFLVTSSSIYAQFGPAPPPAGEEGPEPPPEWEADGPEPPPSAPINQALPFLAIAGAGIAYKAYRKNKKLNQT